VAASTDVNVHKFNSLRLPDVRKNKSFESDGTEAVKLHKKFNF
jgi:hypothetical protein